MKYRHIYTLVMAATAMLFATSCEVEFSPNAEWKEVPVIYCAIDQDADTTWARIEKCYLGDSSIYTYSQRTDSINYPQGSIDVAMLGYRDGALVDSFAMHYTTVDRTAGTFASVAQPMYYSITRGRLHDNYTYSISVRRHADGTLLARSQPSPLVVQTNEKVVSRPNNVQIFSFYENHGANTQFCLVEWPAMQNARLYQPYVRFYYTVEQDTLYTDIPFGTTKGIANANSYTVYYSRSAFLNELKERFKNDTTRKKYIPQVDIYITACTEELNAYLTTATNSNNINEGRETYSNIDGGVGVVGGRRMHLYRTVPADSSLRADMGLYYYILNLGINML